MSYAPSLLQMYSIRGPLRDLVNTLANRLLEVTKSVAISQGSTFSLTVIINFNVKCSLIVTNKLCFMDVPYF